MMTIAQIKAGVIGAGAGGAGGITISGAGGAGGITISGGCSVICGGGGAGGMVIVGGGICLTTTGAVSGSSPMLMLRTSENGLKTWVSASVEDALTLQ